MDKSRMDWCQWCRLTPTSSLAFKASRAVFSLSTWVAMAAVKNQLLTCAYTHRSIHHASIETLLDIMETNIHSTCIDTVICIHMYNIWQRLQRVRVRAQKSSTNTPLSWTAKTPPMVWVLPSHRSSAPILGLIFLSCSRDKTNTTQLTQVPRATPDFASAKMPPAATHQVVPGVFNAWVRNFTAFFVTALATPKNPSFFCWSWNAWNAIFSSHFLSGQKFAHHHPVDFPTNIL